MGLSLRFLLAIPAVCTAEGKRRFKRTLGRLNEAARAADATRGVKEQRSAIERNSVGHKEVPVTQLRKQMLEELQRRNYSQTTVNSYP